MIVKQSNCAQMSLDLHFGCRPFPWCGGLVHLRLAGKASAKLRQTVWLAKRWASCINRWHVSKLQLNAAGIRAKNVIHMSFTAVSCLLCLGCQRAIEVTCREWRHVLQTADRQWTGWKQIYLTSSHFKVASNEGHLGCYISMGHLRLSKGHLYG